MPLHLLKLCVGIDTIADLEIRIGDRLRQRREANEPAEQIHTTRMIPKRIDQLLDNGSLFWVIRGQIAARQPLIDVRPFMDVEGISRCHLVLDPNIIPVEPRPCRPFQGWRYLSEDLRPVDLDPGSGNAEMPEQLRYALRELCLL